MLFKPFTIQSQYDLNLYYNSITIVRLIDNSLTIIVNEGCGIIHQSFRALPCFCMTLMLATSVGIAFALPEPDELFYDLTLLDEVA